MYTPSIVSGFGGKYVEANIWPTPSLIYNIMEEKKVKKVRSLEEDFLRHLNKSLPLALLAKVPDIFVDGKFVEGDYAMIVVEKGLRKAEEIRPVFKRGNFTKKVEKVLYEYGIDKQGLRLHTDRNMERLLTSMLTRVSIGRMFPKKDGVVLESRPLSDEFINLQKFVDFHRFSKRNTPDSEDDIIEYSSFLSKGQKTIDEAIEFYKTNESLTPVQDALGVWLKSKKRKYYGPIENACQLPQMQEISYDTAEQLAEKRKKQREDFKNSLSEGQRAELRQLAVKLAAGK